MRVESGAATDIGKVREGNEDSYVAQEPLFAVADGMGGHRGGEVASQLAVETVEGLFREGETSLVELVREANRTVFERSLGDRAVAGMGTTFTAAVVDAGEARLAHVGDSRAYLLRAGDLRRLTEDHTLVHRMVTSGEITEAEAEVHPHRSVLTRALGTEPDLQVDETVVALLDGDRLLLCTDGLTGMMTEQQVQAILEAEPDPQRAADRLIRAANRAGGIDNITALVLDVREDEESEGGAGSAAPSHPRDGGTGGPRPPTLTRPSRPTLMRWGLRGGIALLAVVVGLVAVRVYVDRQWYVGTHQGHVAVFQGIPAEIGGFRFSHVVEEETDLPAASIEQLPLYVGLEDGITANTREDAVAIVTQMRRDVLAPGGAGS